MATKERKPWIDAVNEPELHAYICGICRLNVKEVKYA